MTCYFCGGTIGYYEVDVGLPTNGDDLRIMGIADLNNDKLNDLIMIDSAGTSGSVYYFDDDMGTYAHSASFKLPTGYTCDGILPTAIPSALQDLIVVASKVDESTDTTETKLFYYTQSDMGSASASSGADRYSWTETSNTLNSLSLYPGSQPLALDINGDQAMDLLYQSADVTEGV